MNREEIFATFKSLARSQGFYGRLLQSLLESDEEDRDSFMESLVEQKFKDPVDLVMYLETEHEEIYH